MNFSRFYFPKDSGVRVYVMVFKEMSFAIGLNSLHTKRALIGKSKKGFIKVRRSIVLNIFRLMNFLRFFFRSRSFDILIIIPVEGFFSGLIMKKSLSSIRKLLLLVELIFVLAVGTMNTCGKKFS